MNKTIVKLIAFLSGAAVGAGTTYAAYHYTKAKKMDQEVAEIRDIYKNKLKEVSETVDRAIANASKTEEETSPKDKSVINQIKPMTEAAKKKAQEYKEAVEKYSTESKVQKPRKNPPILIKPEDFGEKDGYDCVTLTYIEEDGVFLDDNDEVVDSALRNIGKENLNHFSDYEPDVLYVRNEGLSVDFEIILKEDISYKEYMSEIYGDED